MFKALQHSNHRGSHNGFTLIELMTTIAVMGIMFAIGVPAMSNYVNNRQAEGLSRQLMTDLQFARSQAITTATQIDVQANGGDWNDGWQIRQNGTSVDLRITNLTDETSLSVSFDESGVSTFGFDASGQATNTGSLTLTQSNCTGDRVYQIQITAIGQVIQRASTCP